MAPDADQAVIYAKRAEDAEPRTMRPRWAGVVLVCGKCLKRHDDGKGLRRAMKAETKARTAGGRKRRKVRVVTTSCLGLCPRNAIVAASAGSLSTGEVVLLRNRDDAPAAVRRLLGSGGEGPKTR